MLKGQKFSVGQYKLSLRSNLSSVNDFIWNFTNAGNNHFPFPDSQEKNWTLYSMNSFRTGGKGTC